MPTKKPAKDDKKMKKGKAKGKGKKPNPFAKGKPY